MILFVHNRYRTTGGEERAVEDLMWLAREHLGEDVELLARESESSSRLRAARGLIGGGLRPEEVERAVRRTGARIVHAHNLNPAFGWRALAAARRAGARTILHLHQYRLVCAVGVCFTDGADCTRCHGRNTLPGIRHNCRGSRAEAALYAASLSLWQRRMAAQADAFAVPSTFALERLHTLGAPVDPPRVHILPHVVRELAERAPQRRDGPALLVSRLAPEKGVDTAIAACRIAGVELLIAGDGPERGRLEALGADAACAFSAASRRPSSPGSARRPRSRSRPAARPRRSAWRRPRRWRQASRWRARGSARSRELIPTAGLVPPGDPAALASAIDRVRADPQAGAAALARARKLVAPEVVAARLRQLYEAVAPR